MTVRNEKIYAGMRELVKKALAILDRGGFECGKDLDIKVDINNIPPISFLQNDTINGQIDSKREAIEKTHEFAHACYLISLWPPPLEGEQALRRQQFKWNDIPLFLNAYCNLKRDLKFDETIFNGIYKRFEDRLYGKNYVMCLCPLKKFYLGACDGELVLYDGIKIRKISQEELSFINRDMANNTLKKLEEIQFTIEYSYDENEFGKPQGVDDWDWSPWQHASDFCEKKFIEIVALLRLFKDGDFHNPLEIFQVPYWDTVPKGIHFNLCDRRIPEDRNYILKREEAEDFKEFYKKSLRFSGDRRLFIALDRFNLAYEKKRFEDNIIDYVIAFETLFGTEEKSRIGMRIELKSGFLVEDSKEKITEIYKFMRDVYELRSRIVHGDEITFPMKIGGNNYYLDHHLKSAIIKLFLRLIKCFFDEKRFEVKKEVFAIIEEELKSEENKNKSGEELIESILDKTKLKSFESLRGQESGDF